MSSCVSPDVPPVKFHISHVYEIQGKHKLAKESYERLLAEPNISGSLKADVHRQLGWMHHTIESLGDSKHERQSYSLDSLQRSIESNASSGQNLYFLGRCYASLGKVHDAFLAYRNSVDKTEANADTWCSIGYVALHHSFCHLTQHDSLFSHASLILMVTHAFSHVNLHLSSSTPILSSVEFCTSSRINRWMHSRLTYVRYNWTKHIPQHGLTWVSCMRTSINRMMLSNVT